MKFVNYAAYVDNQQALADLRPSASNTRRVCWSRASARPP
jgi:hypothetical protein